MASQYEKMWAYRLEGMQTALNIVKQKGIDALEAEIRFRSSSRVCLNMTTAELDRATELIKLHTIHTIVILFVSVLHDEFDFGVKRCQRFMDRADKKVDCLTSGYVEWEQMADVIADELGFKIAFGENGGAKNAVQTNNIP